MKRKKKIFETREEYREWLAAREARERALRGHMERIEAELAGRKKPGLSG